ncbi:WW domain-binding protein 11 [Ceratitis capitata]|uniref:WW domain-binding protein 11 n=1 Tax=Ceratitis capitata TaxID=7213 RepID=W8CAK2_CERCA|nr:WW domain-binding protein 11 [Ceratitis capitata]
MGRRSINTTKSGKYMNPTDQARKEARKKELKKNKRQRQMVRAAVLKNKDPGQILEEMEKIDEMEYNVLQPSPLNEKVLRDKRKKLKETFDRVMRLYHNDEPEHWAELKRKEVEYEKKRLKKQQYYESVKHAQSVQIDEIPLPSSSQGPPATNSTSAVTFHVANRLPPPPTALSLPPFAPGAPPGAIKKPNELTTKITDKSSDVKKKELLGVPPGPPPNLLEMKDLDTEAEDDEVELKEYNPKLKASKAKSLSKPNSLQQRMLAISGQNIDEFMKEMENVHKKKEKERESAMRGSDVPSSDEEGKSKPSHKSDGEDGTPVSSRSSDDSDSGDDSENPVRSPKRIRKETNSPKDESTSAVGTPASTSVPVTIPLPPVPPHVGPHITIPAPPMPPVGSLAPSMILRPPPLRPPGALHSFGIRMPPGPPPGPRLHGMGGMPPRMGIRMPPGPPPGMPPRMVHHHKNQQLIHKDQTKGITTITAKPQIRNLSADVTRFVPSTLRVKREETRKPGTRTKLVQEPSNHGAETNKAATKDDAYMQFMNEMQGLL